MKAYQFTDVLYMREKKVIKVENKDKETIAVIKKAFIPDCEKNTTVSFTKVGGTEVRVGIKKRTLKNFISSSYIIESDTQTYRLKDKPWNSLLYFCAEGDISGDKLLIEENWSGELEVKVNGLHSARIKTNELTLRTSLFIEDSVPESSLLFSIIVLMYFMYKIYKQESEFIEEILFD